MNTALLHIPPTIDRPTVKNVPTSPNITEVPQRTAPIREIADTLPEFDPTNDKFLTAEKFIDRANKDMDVYHWDEELLLMAISTSLRGAARMWHDGSRTLHIRWLDFANYLLTEFGSKDTGYLAFNFRGSSALCSGLAYLDMLLLTLSRLLRALSHFPFLRNTQPGSFACLLFFQTAVCKPLCHICEFLLFKVVEPTSTNTTFCSLLPDARNNEMILIKTPTYIYMR